jgi:hypothetical protein
MEDALRMFQSKHPLDSKYNSEAYKYRSKLFRPKTRSVIRKNEAAAATAYFSNVDVVNVAPANEQDPQQVASRRDVQGAPAVPPDEDDPVVHDRDRRAAGRAHRRRGDLAPVLGLPREDDLEPRLHDGRVRAPR